MLADRRLALGEALELTDETIPLRAEMPRSPLVGASRRRPEGNYQMIPEMLCP